jgi:hypothetical protein
VLCDCEKQMPENTKHEHNTKTFTICLTPILAGCAGKFSQRRL